MSFWDRLFGKRASAVQRGTFNPPLEAQRPSLAKPQPPPTPSKSQTTASHGITTILKVCSNRRYRLLSLEEDPTFNQAIEELKREGQKGAQALAYLMNELLAARCAEIQDVLQAASYLPSQPELVSALQKVISASPVITWHQQGRFPPVIAGGGKIGWDDAFAARIKKKASEVLASLAPAPATATATAIPQAASGASAVIHELQSATDQNRKCELIKSLSKHRGQEVVETLVRFLKDPDERVKLYAIGTLQDVGDPRAVEPLLEVLMTDPAHQPCYYATKALARLKTPSAIAGMIAALESQKGDLGELALQLGELRAREGVAVLSKLAEGFGGGSAYARRHAVMSLGNIRDRRAIPALQKALSDSDEGVRERAQTALNDLEGSQSSGTATRSAPPGQFRCSGCRRTFPRQRGSGLTCFKCGDFCNRCLGEFARRTNRDSYDCPECGGRTRDAFL